MCSIGLGKTVLFGVLFGRVAAGGSSSSATTTCVVGAPMDEIDALENDSVLSCQAVPVDLGTFDVGPVGGILDRRTTRSKNANCEKRTGHK
jgi:hypothetical protein